MAAATSGIESVAASIITMAVITPAMLSVSRWRPPAPARHPLGPRAGAEGPAVGERVAARPARSRPGARNALKAPVPGARAGQRAGRARPGGCPASPSSAAPARSRRPTRPARRPGRWASRRSAAARRASRAPRCRRGAHPGGDEPAAADDGQVPAARAVGPGEDQLGDGGQRLQPLPAAHGADQDRDPVAQHRGVLVALLGREPVDPGQQRGHEGARVVGRRPRGRPRRSAAYSSTDCAPVHGAPHRPMLGQRAGAAEHAQGEPAGALPQRAAPRARPRRRRRRPAGRGTGPRKTPVPGRTRRTTDSRGNGSSVSRTHSARSGNRERRL